MNESKPMVTVSTKNPGLAILLTIIFGPIGMFYSTIVGGIVMSILTIVAIIFGVLTLGLGLIILPCVIWPICILWAALAASSYNRKILAQR